MTQDLNKSIFKLTLDNAGKGILLINKAGAIKYLNNECTNIFGYSSNNLVGMKIDEISISKNQHATKFSREIS